MRPGRVSSRVPETIVQARTWQTVERHYLDYGLCDPCSAMAAWAVQLGFGHPGIRPPCTECAPRVAALPSRVNSQASPWRRLTPGIWGPKDDAVDVDVAGGVF